MEDTLFENYLPGCTVICCPAIPMRFVGPRGCPRHSIYSTTIDGKSSPRAYFVVLSCRMLFLVCTQATLMRLTYLDESATVPVHFSVVSRSERRFLPFVRHPVSIAFVKFFAIEMLTFLWPRVVRIAGAGTIIRVWLYDTHFFRCEQRHGCSYAILLTLSLAFFVNVYGDVIDIFTAILCQRQYHLTRSSCRSSSCTS